MQIQVGIITISDRASKGLYDDLGGPALKKAAEGYGWKVVAEALVADQEAVQLGRTGPRRHDGDRRPVLGPAPARFRPDPSARSASLLAQSGISSL